MSLARRIALAPHATGLDVAAIAFFWQRIAAGLLDVPVPIAVSLLLATTVWGIYLLDRVWDVRRANGELSAIPHRLAAKHPRLWRTGGLFALGLSAILAPLSLPFVPLAASAAVALLCVVYYAGRGRWGEPTRAVVLAFIFAAGCLAVPLASGSKPASALAFGLALACVLAANALECQRSQLPAGETKNKFLWPAVGASFLFGLMFGSGDLLIAAGALVMVNRFGPGFHHDTHAALAEAALLTPVLVRLAVPVAG